MKIEFNSTFNLIKEIFKAYGFSKSDAEIITNSLLAADLAGIESHGVQRMIRYDDAIRRNMVDVNAKPEIVWETPISAVIDAKKAMGQIVSEQAMNLAIEKAKTNGIGMIAVRNSNHFGIAGYYARMASKENLIGVAMTNSEAIMVPTFGRKAMLGSNPIALSFPAEPVDFCFDAATTVVPKGKLEVYRKAEKDTPAGWMVDATGEECNNPDKVIKNIDDCAGGGILPLGGAAEQNGSHKGYGFGMICELFTSVLSGGPKSYQSYKEPGVADSAHYFMAINCNLFGEPKELKKSCSELLEDLRNCPAKEGKKIYVHGEKEANFEKIVKETGISVNIKTVEEIKEIASRMNVTFKINVTEE